MNAKIIHNMECMLKINKSMNEKWKVRAYNDSINKLKSYDKQINSVDDIVDLKLGKGILDKIKYIIENDTDLPQVLNSDMNKSNIINTLSTIHNIGTTKAKYLVEEHHITSIEDLKERSHLLNEKQIQGLKYHDDIQHKIPHSEMVLHDIFIKQVLYHSFEKFSLVGSYRRGNAESGDIDLIVISNSKFEMKDLVESLIEKEYILGDGIFAMGKKKFMGMCILPFHQIARRLDILFCSALEYPYALLYFTGNKEFNVKMREHAKQLGYTLNEKGLWMNAKTRVKSLYTEKDVFDSLKIRYLEPQNRCGENFSCI